MKCDLFKALLLLGLVGFCLEMTLAQANPQKPQTFKAIGLEDIRQRIQATKDKQNLADELKNRILADYYESEDNLSELQAQESQAERYKATMASLPLDLKQVQKQIAEAESNIKNLRPERYASFPTDELEQRLIIEKTRLSDLDAEIGRNEGQVNDLVMRPQVIRQRIAEVRAKQATALQEQQSLLARDMTTLQEKEARQVVLESRIRLANSALKTFELENLSAPMSLQLHKDQLHLLSLQREQLTLLIGDLDNFLLERRQQAIDKEQAALMLAEKEAEGKHPLIREATRQNMIYNRSLQDVNKNTEHYLLQKNEIEVRNKQLEKDFQSAEQKITLAGLSPVLGNLLREQRRNLPQPNQFSQLNEDIQHEIAMASLEMFKLDELKKQLLDVNQVLLTHLNPAQIKNLDDTEKVRLRSELRLLFNDQKDLVFRLSGAYVEYARVLGDVDFNLQQMLGGAEKFGAYLDERLLWVPSAPVISDDYLKDIFYSLLWFLNPASWLQVLFNLGRSAWHAPWGVVLLAASIGLLWRYRSSSQHMLDKLLVKGGANPYSTGFGQILHSLVASLWLSLPGPLLVIGLACLLLLHRNSDTFSRSVAEGLLAMGFSLAVVQFFYRIFKPAGVAQVLFLWQDHASQLVYRQLQWSRFVVLPCIFIISMTGSDLFSEHSYALGRTAQIVMMAVLAFVLHRLCHPGDGLGRLFYQDRDNWFIRLRYVWYGVAVMVPLVIIGFAVAGYYQSALELQAKLIASLRLLIVIILFHALAQRWLAVTQRQLALQNAKYKRKQADQASSGVEGAYPPEENLHDISTIYQQSHKLLATLIAVGLMLGLWMIWSDILPAFSVFQRVELWQYLQRVDGKETLQAVTLVNVLLCLLYGGLTMIFVANFPALVDLLSVGKFALAPGSRYALIQLVRYSLISIAFLAIANELGGSWSQVQWLVAALSVGLGFGLQEIFANMVSGIILLFERPIRVGDTVTIGDVTGRVSRIQMRATHIVDWDRKELVVPNKIFITGQLINWTLSDTVTRIVMPVGVPYGTDIELVERILRDAVLDCESVLDDPEPTVSFMGFGESALDFKVNVFVRELSDRIPVIHELHKKIYAALHQHHIEIPFPQRDVHIRSAAEGVFRA